MGNSDSNPWIGLTQEFQEIEKIRFSYDLRKNPDDYNRYVSERIDRITEETLDKKRAAFQKAHTDMGRYMDMDHNANFYKIRNNDLVGLQDQMVEKSRSVSSGLKHDKDLTRRQVEINEWYFNDKMETLFFLQLFFIILLAVAIVLYLQKNNYITMPLLTFILFGVVVVTGLYRWRYTKDFRDGRFWNKRNFREKELYVPKPVAETCGPTDFFPKELSDCARKALNAAEDAGEAALGYAADSARPYENIALGTAMGVGLGVGTAAGGITLGAATVAGSVAGGAGMLAYQGLSDSRTLANRGGAAAARAGSQLEQETIAYITGDNRVDPDPNAKLTCPF